VLFAHELLLFFFPKAFGTKRKVAKQKGTIWPMAPPAQLKALRWAVMLSFGSYHRFGAGFSCRLCGLPSSRVGECRFGITICRQQLDLRRKNAPSWLSISNSLGNFGKDMMGRR
jgi:hypothetical protein